MEVVLGYTERRESSGSTTTRAPSLLREILLWDDLNRMRLGLTRGITLSQEFGKWNRGIDPRPSSSEISKESLTE
jgi:hypothetical protein